MHMESWIYFIKFFQPHVLTSSYWCDLNMQDGESPLHLAVESKSAEMVALLIFYGEDRKAKDKVGPWLDQMISYSLQTSKTSDKH